MMTPESGLDSRFDQLLEEKLVSRRERRLQHFDAEPLAWLALVPAWTRPLAESLGLPVGDLEPWLADLERRGLIHRSQRPGEAGFWVLDDRRAEMLENLRRRLDTRALEELTWRLGHRLHEIGGLAPVVSRWAEVARETADSPEQGAEWLQEKLLGELETGSTAAVRDWVQAGELLAQAFPGAFAPVADLGRRRLELLYRRLSDHRHLENFLERKEQIAAFERLLEGRDGIWALHYLGLGGVGKTTLIRHLCSRLAPSLSVKVARVDFDHLSPDFPLRRPAQLLLELAADLHLQADDIHLFEVLENKSTTLAEALSGGEAPDSDPLTNLHRGEFLQLQNTFVDILRRSGRVVLLLDTCEELAKIHAAGVVRPSLLATFEIVERLQKEVPDLRVIFAGRRLLARAGSGWAAPGRGHAADLDYLPPEKPYLGLHLIQGFTREEAGLFFDLAGESGGFNLASPLRRAILDRSRVSLDSPTAIAVGGAAAGEARFNPFDLSLYTEWAREDPTLDATTISSGDTDPYVQLRIVDRIHFPRLRRALPAVALLGRFEAADLQPVLSGVDAATFEGLVRELADQEWIEVQRDEALGTRLLEVNRHLLPRLLAYLASGERRVEVAAARARLGSALARRVLKLPMGQVGYDLLNNSLRLASEVEQVEIWRRVEEAFPGGGTSGNSSGNSSDGDCVDASWAAAIGERLLAEGGAAAELDHPLRAAVRALHLAAQQHLGNRFEHLQGWLEVAERAVQHPDEETRAVLGLRGLAGQVASFGPEIQGFPDNELLERFFRSLGRNLDAASAARAARVLPAQVAALETLLDRSAGEPELRQRLEEAAENFWAGRPPARALQTGALTTALRLWSNAAIRQGCSRTAASFACLLAARVAVGDEARKLFDKAWQRIPRDPGETFADWLPPESLADRIRLERFWRELPGDGHRDYQTWLEQTRDHLHTLDGDRLASVCIMGWLRHELVPAEQLKRLEKLESQVEHAVSASRPSLVHRLTPSLLSSLAQGWLSLGDGKRAWRLLSDRLALVAATRERLAAVMELEKYRLVCLRDQRWHVRGQDSLINASSAEATDLRGLAWETMALLGPPTPRNLIPLTNLPKLRIRERWRSLCLLGEDGLAHAGRLAVDLLGEALEVESGDRERLEIYLALEELRQAMRVAAPELGERLSPLPPPPEYLEPCPVAAGGAGALPTESSIRLGLRARALAADQESAAWTRELAVQVEDLDATARSIGWRRLGELALEEGQLLALRLPLAGRVLLDIAWDAMTCCGDLYGALRCGALGVIASFHGADRNNSERLDARVREPYETLQDRGFLLAPWFLVQQFVDSMPSSQEQDDFGEDYQENGVLHRLFGAVATVAETTGGHAERYWDLLRDVYRRSGIPAELDARLRLELPEKGRDEVVRRLQASWETLLGRFAPDFLAVPLGPTRGSEPVRETGDEEADQRLPEGQGGGKGKGLGLGLPEEPEEPPSPIQTGTWGLRDYSYGPLDDGASAEKNDGVIDEAPDEAPPPPAGIGADGLEIHIDSLSNEPFRPYSPVRAVVAMRSGVAGGEVSFRHETKELEATAPYRTLVDPFVAPRVRLLDSFPSGELPPVSLDVSSLLAAFPWEALFGLHTGALPNLVRVDHRSTGPGYDLGTLGQRAPWKEAVFIVGPEPGLEMATSLWGNFTKTIGTSLTPFAGGLVHELQPAMLHLVGHGVETSAGYRLQLGRDGEDLVHPQDYPLANVPLVIIQGTPQNLQKEGRTSTDRDQAVGLRQVAASFFREGASVVLLLPSLPAKLAAPALAAVATRCLSPAFEVSPWLDVAREVRLQVFPELSEALAALRQPGAAEETLDPVEESRLELALEITLFVRHQESVAGSTS